MNTKTAIFAHRGFSAAYPENTMIAFYAAEQLGVDGIELDVQLTKDGQLVVIHDSRLERTTSGEGKVADFTVAQLKELSAGAWFSADFQDERIPLLEEVLDWAKGNKLKINVEIKSTAAQRERILKKITETSEISQLSQRMILSSFDHELMCQLTSALPKIETAVITLGTIHQPEVYLRALGITSWHYFFPMLCKAKVKSLLAEGFILRAFGTHSQNDLNTAFSYHIAAVMTHRPHIALDLRKR